jgi:hypothetical protein
MQVDEAVFHTLIHSVTVDGDLVVQVQRGLDGELVVDELKTEHVVIQVEYKQEQQHV